MADTFGVCAYFTYTSVPPRKSTPSGPPCQNAMEHSPATLKISEKTRKYHFFPRKSMLVSLKNSTLRTIPSKSVVGRQSIVVRAASFARNSRTTIDQRPTTASNTQCFATLFPAQHPIKNYARYKHCRKQVRGQTKNQRRRKTFYRPRAKQKQNRRRNNSSDVRIDD